MLAYLCTRALGHGGLPDDVAKKIAAEVATWIDDANDPSAVGLVAILLDLGPHGETQLVEGLGGAKRDLYVAGLALGGDHYAGAYVTTALLAPLNRRTPRVERWRLLGIAFHLASSSATVTTEDARDRQGEEGRVDFETLLRYVRHRYSIGR